MKFSRSTTALMAFVGIAALSLTACSPAADTGSDSPQGEIGGKITVWSWNAPGEGLKAAIPAFQKLHPGVEVDVQDVGNPAIWDKITTGMAAGGAGLADVLNIGIDYMGNYVEKFPGQLVDLRDHGMGDLADEFPAGAWKSGSGADGAVYGIPYEVNATGFFYRTDLFEEAGIDFEQIKTWDDLLAAGVTIKEKTGADLYTQDKAATVADSGGLWQLQTALQGSFYFDENGEITMSGKEGVRSLELIKEANDLGIVGDVPGGWDALMATVRGERDVATLSAGGWLAGVIENEAPDMAGKWAVAQPPAVTPGGLTAAVNGGTYLSIPTSSKNQATAAAFVEFALGTLEGQKLVYDGGGMFPGYKPLLESPDFSAPSEYYNGQRVNDIFIAELAQKTPAINYTSDYARALKAYTDAQSKVLLEGADPQEALDTAAEQVASQTGRKIAKD
ncbi:extracellular solute-binding protein [Microbacterium sp. H1-D42]|uniref:ABC transporter substrate-binding protein n=1 Tax=Microbacterium sp. H1-D42 TaxID=2925844 RepID=UPI001F53621C|nr:extracellular solute-binding protein [Microbacterium sp. H1-D42]UNK71659.1 extracellular solute-binding protein [Microbacterium sp. H1-D42]